MERRAGHPGPDHRVLECRSYLCVNYPHGITVWGAGPGVESVWTPGVVTGDWREVRTKLWWCQRSGLASSVQVYTGPRGDMTWLNVKYSTEILSKSSYYHICHSWFLIKNNYLEMQQLFFRSAKTSRITYVLTYFYLLNTIINYNWWIDFFKW